MVDFSFIYDELKDKYSSTMGRTTTAGKDKMYVSKIIGQILNIQELNDRNI